MPQCQQIVIPSQSKGKTKVTYTYKPPTKREKEVKAGVLAELTLPALHVNWSGTDTI